MNRKLSGILLVVLLAVGFLWFLADSFNSVDEAAETAITGPHGVDASASPESAADTAVNTIETKDAFFMAVARMLEQRFGERMDNAYWRMKLISDMMQLFRERYPDNWRAELEAFFRMAFPELADDLIAKLAALIEYNDWLDNLKATMKFSSMEERQAALWDKRLALFGDEAYDIWEAALKNEQLQQKLKTVDNFTGSFSEKAALYRDSLKEVFGNEVLGEDAPHKTQKLTKFLELEGVQSELYRLPESERYAELRAFRESLGMDEQALERWDELDESRRQMWSNADTYMDRRQQLTRQYQGAELEQQLHSLRVEMFGETEAKYIANEEGSGYFRFEKPQQIGLN